ncbi:MAG: hypothetical protein R2695_19160 [Acidimicrobiales bacterium]
MPSGSALRTVLDGHLTMAAGMAGRQWNEGDVSCSVVRRVVLPDAFFAADGLLQTALVVFDELGFFPAMIDAELSRDLPFLATTRILTAAVDRGLGRETAHELVKDHAVAAALDRRSAPARSGWSTGWSTTTASRSIERRSTSCSRIAWRSRERLPARSGG